MTRSKKCIIENVPAVTYQGVDCYINSIANVLQYYGYHPEFCLGINYDFYYRKNNFSESFVGHKNITTLLTEVFEIGFYQPDAEVIQVDIDKMLEEIERADPLVLFADIFHLAYIPSYYHQSHGTTTLILHGYDNHAKTFHIIDAWPYLFRGVLSLPELILALQDAPKRFLKVVPSNVELVKDRGRLLNILKNNFLNMSNGRLESSQFVSGLDGIKYFANDLSAFQQFNDDLIFQKMEMAFETLIKTASQRKFHQKFIEIVSESLKMPELAALADNYQGIAQNWMLVRNMFIKGNRAKDRDILPRIQQKLWELHDQESKTVAALGEILMEIEPKPIQYSV